MWLQRYLLTLTGASCVQCVLRGGWFLHAAPSEDWTGGILGGTNVYVIINITIFYDEIYLTWIEGLGSDCKAHLRRCLLVYINLDPPQPATAIKSYNWIYPVVDAGFLRRRGRKIKKGTTWTHHCSESQVWNLKVKRGRFTVCSRHETWHKLEIYTFLISLI